MRILKYISRHEELRQIPIIMMSAQDEVSIVVKCLRLGAADYLVKPLRTNELLNLWIHMWRRRRMVCDDRHSELIPCLDRHLIYQMRMKLDLSVMEHYERHCPPSERWYNCLIPPPPGYKIPIKWP